MTWVRSAHGGERAFHRGERRISTRAAPGQGRRRTLTLSGSKCCRRHTGGGRHPAARPGRQPRQAALVVDGGVFDLENGGQTVGSLSGTGGPHGSGNLTVQQSTDGASPAASGQRWPAQGGQRNSDPDRRQRLYRHHRRQCRHAAARARRGLASSTPLFVTAASSIWRTAARPWGGLAGFDGAVNLGNNLTIDVDQDDRGFAGSIGGTGGL